MLLKVWSATGLKKAVVADNLKSLLEKGSLKLNLNENIAAYMEDGTEIDDDEIFSCLKESTVVYLLQESDEKPWIKKVDNLENESGRLNVMELERPQPGLNLRGLPWPTDFIIPVEKFSSDLRAAVNLGDLNWTQRTELMLHIAQAISVYTDCPNICERKQVAFSLIKQFPALKSEIGDGTHVWCIRIFDRMRELRRYKRKQQPDYNIRKTAKATKLQKRCRGEINWAPPPPDGEDALTLETHKEWLRKEFEKPVPSQNKKEISVKMELCFSSRRLAINSTIMSIKKLKEEFPFIFSVDGLFKEFFLLMAIDIDKTFLAELNVIAPKVIVLIQQKKKVPEPLSVILQDFARIPTNDKHINNTLVLAILGLPFLFQEEDLYKLYPSDTSIESICQGPTTPHVAVIGSPFTSSLVYLVAEKEIVLETHEFLVGIVSLISLYYSFNIEYPKQGRLTFQFMDLQLLKLKNQNTLARKLSTVMEKLSKL